jgi:Tol biopolymer transport system component
LALAALMLTAGCTAGSASPSTGGASPSVVGPSPSAPAFPGGRIAFDRVSADGHYVGTYLAASDGSNADPVQVGFAPDPTAGPLLSPDGGLLLANTYFGGDASRSWITNLDTLESTLLDPPSLVAGAGIDCGAWSPDGNRLLCTVDADQAPDVEGIYELTIASLNLRRLTQGNPSVVGSEGECGGNDSSPVYSPHGTRFAFLRVLCGQLADPGRDQTGALMVENLDGSGMTEVVAPGGILSHLGGIGWTDNGDWIVFVTEAGVLTLVHPDGTGKTSIHLDLSATTSNGFAQQPTWSPDGTWLIFSLYMGDQDQLDLYAATPAGENLIKIAGGPDAEVSASWRPAP